MTAINSPARVTAIAGSRLPVRPVPAARAGEEAWAVRLDVRGCAKPMVNADLLSLLSGAMTSSFPLRQSCPPGACTCARERLLDTPGADLRILRLTRAEEGHLLELLESIASLSDLERMQQRMYEQLGIRLHIAPGGDPPQTGEAPGDRLRAAQRPRPLARCLKRIRWAACAPLWCGEISMFATRCAGDSPFSVRPPCRACGSCRPSPSGWRFPSLAARPAQAPAGLRSRA